MIQVQTNIWISKESVLSCTVARGIFYIHIYGEKIFEVHKEYVNTVCKTLGIPLNTVLAEIEKSKFN